MILVCDLFWLAFTSLTAAVAGYLVLRRLLRWELSPLAKLWLSVSLGYLFFIAGVFALGIFYWFRRDVVLSLFLLFWVGILGHCAGRLVMREFWDLLRGALSTLRLVFVQSRHLAVTIGVLCGLAFLGGGTPEVRGDPIIYHITEAWLYVVNQGHVEIPSSALTYIPQNQQLLYALALLLGSDSLAKWYHWSAGVLLLCGTYVLSRRLGASRESSLGAVVLLASFPMWFLLATTTYIDLGVGNELLAAVYLVTLALNGAGRGQGSETSAPRLFALAGVFIGAALGSKYTAGLVGLLPILVSYIVVAPWGGGDRIPLRRVGHNAMSLAIASLAAFSPWLIRNGYWTGNPLAPSFIDWLGPASVPESTRRWPDILAVPAEPVWPLSALVLSYVKMFFALSDYGNFLPNLAAVALVAAFLALDGKQRPRVFQRCVVFLALFLAISFLIGTPFAALRRDSRYIMAHVGVMAALVALSFDALQGALPTWRGRLQRIATAVLALVVVSGAIQIFLRFSDLRESILPRWSVSARDAYCEERLQNYRANRAIGRYISPRDGKVLGAAYPARVHYVLGGAPMTPDLSVQSPERLAPEHLFGLRRQGVRYILGAVSKDLSRYLEKVADVEGLPLWKITNDPGASFSGESERKSPVSASSSQSDPAHR